MSNWREKTRIYILYSLCFLVIIVAALTFILSLYRLQRDANLLNRERKRDYVTNKINKSFPMIAMIISMIVCLVSILTYIAVLLDVPSEIFIIFIVSNIILGIGLIVLAVIMLGFIENIVNNFPLDIERLLVDFIVNNKTSAHDELLKIENSNDCCTTQDPIWTKKYSQAAECNRDERIRTFYADQDEKRGCVKIISRTALSLMPVLISEIICGCLCLFLGLWTIYVTYHHTNLTSANNVDSSATQIQPPMHPLNSDVLINDRTVAKLVENSNGSRQSYPPVAFYRAENPLYRNTISSSIASN